jgi:hypothetical protein
MRVLPIRFVPILALAAIGASTLTDPSLAETKRQVAGSLCDMAGGTFVVERDGKYSCLYPPSVDGNAVKNCTADGRCTVTNCRDGGRTCITVGVGDKGKKPPKVIKTKREDGPQDGPKTMTAGTASDRFHPVNAGAATNTALKGGTSTGAAAGLATSTGSGPAASKTVGIKPTTTPAQLSERLNRLQQR